MKLQERTYREMTINSSQLIIPRETYQRELNPDRVRKIVKEFGERVANEPKVSCRNGKYYVFDGQHTIAARKILNRNRDLPITCKVYYGMTESEEAMLFATQTGASAPLSAGARIRALVYAGDPEAIAFMKVTESTGLALDYELKRGKKKLACVSTAFTQFKKLGAERYREALKILITAWGGDMESLRGETVQGICRFVDLYYGEFDPRRLVLRLRRVDPLTIYREGKAMGVNMPASQKYLYQVFRIYNGSSKVNALPLKF